MIRLKWGKQPVRVMQMLRLSVGVTCMAAYAVPAVPLHDIEPLPSRLLLQFRELTMRLAFLLQTTNERLLINTLNDKVDEYHMLVQLLHTAADDKLLSLGLLNFDTMEPDFPPGACVLC
jgi:hypothetical protein